MVDTKRCDAGGLTIPRPVLGDTDAAPDIEADVIPDGTLLFPPTELPLLLRKLFPPICPIPSTATAASSAALARLLRIAIAFLYFAVKCTGTKPVRMSGKSNKVGSVMKTKRKTRYSTKHTFRNFGHITFRQ